MGWFTKKIDPELLPAYRQQMTPYHYESKPVLDINSNTHVMQGIGQQIASIGPNQAFDIEVSQTAQGSRVRFAKVGIPPMVAPMAQGSDDVASLKKEMKKLRHELERAKFSHVKQGGRMEVNGIPCMLRRTPNGYDLMRIGPDGQLEFMAHLGASI